MAGTPWPLAPSIHIYTDTRMSRRTHTNNVGPTLWPRAPSACSYTVVTLSLHLLHCCYTVVTLLQAVLTPWPLAPSASCYTSVTLLLHCSHTIAGCPYTMAARTISKFKVGPVAYVAQRVACTGLLMYLQDPIQFDTKVTTV
jgi:hypothetical protein